MYTGSYGCNWKNSQFTSIRDLWHNISTSKQACHDLLYICSCIHMCVKKLFHTDSMTGGSRREHWTGVAMVAVESH